MRRNHSSNSTSHQKSESACIDRESQGSKSNHSKTLNIAPLNLNSLSSNNGNYLEQGLDIMNHKQQQQQQKVSSSATNYEKLYTKLASNIIDFYMNMKHQTLDSNPNCVLMLKKSVPFDEDDEKTCSTDPMILIQYIKCIFEKNIEFKNDAEKELAAKKESECSDYEAMLQKLEAEVRQHIRIEQQLKLYAESTQSKLDELEKNNDPTKLENLKKEIEALKSDKQTLHDKIQKRENDIELAKRELRAKNEAISNLEKQVETVGPLKSKIRELEKMIGFGGTTKSSSNTLKVHNGHSNKETENYSKTISLANGELGLENTKIRKGSQPVVGFQTSEISKLREKNKENIDAMRLEGSTKLSKEYNSRGSINNKENQHYFQQHFHNEERRQSVRPESSSGKQFTRYDEKLEEYAIQKKQQEQMKKAHKSDSSRTLGNKDKFRDENAEFREERERPSSNMRSYSQKITNDMIESSKFSTDKMARHENERRQSDVRDLRGDYKLKHKSDHHLKRSESRPTNEYTESEPSTFSNKNYIPKPARPQSGYDSVGGNHDSIKYRKEAEAKAQKQESSKMKGSSPKKSFQDRSHSVDATHKFYRQNKTKTESNEQHRQEDYSRTYNAKEHNQYVQGQYNSGMNATAQNMGNALKPANYQFQRKK